MASIGDDETIISLRRVCDRYAGHIPESGHALPHGLVRDIFSCLPSSIFGCVGLPAVGTDNHRLALRVDPLFYVYMAAATEYWLAIVHRKTSLKGTTVPAKAAAD